METKDYYLGFDIGTGSVGWAVTDENYQLKKVHGKTLWGSRLFETAVTAEERRGFRAARRRLERRKNRIELLQELFADEISKVDKGFYHRLKESRYVAEDKRDISGGTPDLPYALFADSDFSDKDYHVNYPTIYHLRRALMKQEEPFDVRLVYLAVHHILKHRGHFLFEGKKLEDVREFKPAYQSMVDALEELPIDEDERTIVKDVEKMQMMAEIIADKSKGKSVKKAELWNCFGTKNKCEKEILVLLAGGTVKLSNIFEDKSLDEAEKPKLSFSDSNYDEYETQIEDALQEKYIVISSVKAVYDWSLLNEILQGYDSLSEAKVAIYEKHREDLRRLKGLFREKDDDTYSRIFGYPQDKEKNYSAYIGMVKVNGRKKALLEGRCNREEFYSFLKKILIEIEDERAQDILEDIEQENFLPRQVIKDNGVIPYQVHKMELIHILEKAQKYLPFLAERDESGYSISEKILKIMEFRIPYYVGPLNTTHTKENGGFAWAVRKEEGKIYPWNFEEKIDVEQSAEKFIRNMTNKCTYLLGKDVLPKYSLLYSEYMILNELNNVRLNGELLSVELKKQIYNDLFMRFRRVTQKKLKEYLYQEGLIEKKGKEYVVEISGIDGDFKASNKAELDFREILTNITLTNEQKERLVLDITIFGGDKKLLKKRIRLLVPELSDKQVERLSQLKYDGWGRISREFFTEVEAPNPETGEVLNIINMLRETQDNLMQILSSKYEFAHEISRINEKCTAHTELSYKNIDEMYLSPAVKRQTWQSIKLAKEIKKIMGGAPKRIFIEMAREKQESRQTVSRRKRLLELYRKCKDEERDWVGELTDADDNSLRSDRLYLYYTQMGRCMYSGEKIDLDRLYDKNVYDVDHIYPQARVMDDSLDNRVLVRREYNAEKKDKFPIKSEWQKERAGFWKALLSKGFISKEKYKRLTRKDSFTAEELTGFIARQIVETRQSTKAVAEILKQVFSESELVYVKAGNVSAFRQKFKLLKIREMNDLHHAKDAYLNIVVGNAYYTRFTKDASWFVKKYPNASYNLNKMFEGRDIERKGEVAWKAGEGGTISVVKKMLAKNNAFVTRRSYEAKGGLFDQMPMKRGHGQVPLKGNDERLQSKDKYGGYNKASGAYFVLVESENKKGNRIRTIEFVPVYLARKLEESEENMRAYLKENLGLINPNILISKIRIDTLFEVNGFCMYLSGRTGNRLLFKGANQLILNSESQKVLKKVLKFAMRYSNNKNAAISRNDELEDGALNDLYNIFYEKTANTVYNVRLEAQVKNLENGRDTFLSLSREEKCLVLAEILHLFQCNSTAANLKRIGGGASAGILVMNNNITELDDIAIIHQSPTGFYEQRIDLKKGL